MAVVGGGRWLCMEQREIGPSRILKWLKAMAHKEHSAGISSIRSAEYSTDVGTDLNGNNEHADDAVRNRRVGFRTAASHTAAA